VTGAILQKIILARFANFFALMYRSETLNHLEQSKVKTQGGANILTSANAS